MSEITFEVNKELGCLREFPNGWAKLVRIVTWNEGTPKIDIRDWDETRERMSRGITLSFEEFEKLKTLNI